MTSSIAQDRRSRRSRSWGHEREFSELNKILADVTQSPPAA
jgi:hypothetical protein